jgi:cytosine/adenosine deaminase-related metal-dependent hydrolase
MYTILSDLKEKIIAKGGFVNAHCHLDRAGTAKYFTKEEQYKFLKEKWKLVDKIKKQSDYWTYKSRIDRAITNQANMGVSTICSFIDIDDIASSRAILAARELTQERQDVCFYTACQTLKGVLDPGQDLLLRNSLIHVNIIGSLPGADKDREAEHIDKVMGWAKKYKKRLHVHVDQLNTPKEKETELLARKTMQHGLEGRVTAVHSISLAAHPKHYREDIYKMSKDAGLSFISCPSAWIDHPRREDLVPSHNAITPVDELLKHDLVVAIGSDNIHDIYKPYADGDMMFELRMLLEACKIYDEEQLIKIATENGKKVLGIT